MSTHVIDVRGETAVSAGTWRDARYVTVAAPNAYYLHLTAEQAEKLAAGLITHASKLREPSEIPSTPIMALIGDWQRQVAERRNLRDSMGTEGNRTYQAAYADGVDGCVHALKALLESRPADEGRIRDAMAEARDNSGRMVTVADAAMCPDCGHNRTLRADGSFESHHVNHDGVTGPPCPGGRARPDDDGALAGHDN